MTATFDKSSERSNFTCDFHEIHENLSFYGELNVCTRSVKECAQLGGSEKKKSTTPCSAEPETVLAAGGVSSSQAIHLTQFFFFFFFFFFFCTLCACGFGHGSYDQLEDRCIQAHVFFSHNTYLRVSPVRHESTLQKKGKEESCPAQSSHSTACDGILTGGL